MKNIVILIVVHVLLHNSQGIRVLSNDVQVSRASWCVGEQISLVCTIDDDSYKWNVDSPHLTGKNALVDTTSGTLVRGPFTLSTLVNEFAGTVSFLNVTVFDGMDESISCEGANRNTGQFQLVQITIKGTSTTEPPRIQAQGSRDLTYFTISITPPPYGLGCFTQYNVSISEDTKVYYRVFTPESEHEVETIDSRQLFPQLQLDLCQYKYTFEVALGKTLRSGPVAGNVNLEGIGKLGNLQTQSEYVTWDVPERLSNCIIGYAFRLHESNYEGSLPLKRSYTRQEFIQHLNTPCKADILAIVPIVRANSEALPSSSVSKLIVGDHFFRESPSVQPESPTSIQLTYRLSIAQCPGLIFSVRVIHPYNNSIMQEYDVPPQDSSFSLTNLVRNTTYVCAIELSVTQVGSIHSEKISCKTEKGKKSSFLLIQSDPLHLLIVTICLPFWLDGSFW